MKRSVFIVGCIAALLFLWSCCEECLEPDNIESELHYKVVEGKGLSVVMMNGFRNNNSNFRNVVIYTPPGYSKNGDKKYPVLYLLHGLPFTEKAYIDIETWDPWIGGSNPFQEYPDFPAEGFRKWVDGMIDQGIIEPMIIVMPNAASNLYGFSFYTNSVVNGNFEDFIVKDLVNYIDKNYKTITNRKGRSVVGNSQGGYAAFRFGLLHPDVFGVVASHTGLLYLDGMLALGKVVVAENPYGFAGPDPNKFLTSATYSMSSAWSPNLNNPPFYVDLPFGYPSGNVIPKVRDRWMQNDVFTMLDIYHRNFESLEGIYMDAGLQDELGMNQMMYAFAQKLDAYGIPYVSEEFEGGHVNKLFSRFERSFAFCSERMK